MAKISGELGLNRNRRT